MRASAPARPTIRRRAAAASSGRRWAEPRWPCLPVVGRTRVWPPAALVTTPTPWWSLPQPVRAMMALGCSVLWCFVVWASPVRLSPNNCDPQKALGTRGVTCTGPGASRTSRVLRLLAGWSSRGCRQTLSVGLGRGQRRGAKTSRTGCQRFVSDVFFSFGDLRPCRSSYAVSRLHLLHTLTQPFSALPSRRPRRGRASCEPSPARAIVFCQSRSLEKPRSDRAESMFHFAGAKAPRVFEALLL